MGRFLLWLVFASAAEVVSTAAGAVIDKEEHPDVDESDPSSKSCSIRAEVVGGTLDATGDNLPIGSGMS